MDSTILMGNGAKLTLASAARSGCTDVIIHADGTRGAWTNGLDPLTLPLGGNTLIGRLLAQVTDALNPTITVVTPTENAAVVDQVAAHASMARVRNPRADARGSAGFLKDAASSLSGGTILVIGGAIFVDDDLAWMVRQHRAARNALTVFRASKPITLRGDVLSTLEPVSIYCCEPDVIQHIAADGLQDIATHLIPALQRAGERVGVVTLRGDTREVYDWASYLTVLGAVLKRDVSNDQSGYEQHAPGVWCHAQAELAASARFVGPVLIDRGCRIGAGAVIVGPTVLGPGCTVEPNARIVRTVAAEGTCFSTRTVVSDRLLVGDALAGESTRDRVTAGDFTARSTSGARGRDLVASIDTPARHAVWFGAFLVAISLMWALSGTVVTVWQAWAGRAFHGVG